MKKKKRQRKKKSQKKFPLRLPNDIWTIIFSYDTEIDEDPDIPSEGMQHAAIRPHAIPDFSIKVTDHVIVYHFKKKGKYADPTALIPRNEDCIARCPWKLRWYNIGCLGIDKRGGQHVWGWKSRFSQRHTLLFLLRILLPVLPRLKNKDVLIRRQSSQSGFDGCVTCVMS